MQFTETSADGTETLRPRPGWANGRDVQNAYSKMLRARDQRVYDEPEQRPMLQSSDAQIAMREMLKGRPEGSSRREAERAAAVLAQAREASLEPPAKVQAQAQPQRRAHDDVAEAGREEEADTDVEAKADTLVACAACDADLEGATDDGDTERWEKMEQVEQERLKQQWQEKLEQVNREECEAANASMETLLRQQRRQVQEEQNRAADAGADQAEEERLAALQLSALRQREEAAEKLQRQLEADAAAEEESRRQEQLARAAEAAKVERERQQKLIEEAEERRRAAEHRAKEERERREREAERQRKEAERRVQQEKERQREIKRQQICRNIGRCVAGFEWIKCSGGYVCAGGSHRVSDAEIEARMH